MLERLGHQVDVASNGRVALEMLERESYDVIFMDVQMPEMDGIEATQRIRQLDDARSQIPIVAVTANAMAGDRETYLEAGMTEYVSKPFSTEDIENALKAIFSPLVSAQRTHAHPNTKIPLPPLATHRTDLCICTGKGLERLLSFARYIKFFDGKRRTHSAVSYNPRQRSSMTG